MSLLSRPRRRPRRLGARAALLTTTALLGATLSPIGLGATAAHAADAPVSELVLADSFGGRILALPTSGGPGRVVTDAPEYPFDVAYGAGRLVVADYDNPLVLDADGSDVEAVPSLNPDGWAAVHGVGMDDSGVAYIGDELNTPSLTVRQPDGGLSSRTAQPIYAHDIAVASDGTLYVATFDSGIWKVSPAGEAILLSFTGDTSPGSYGVALSPDEQTLYMTDQSDITSAPVTGGPVTLVSQGNGELALDLAVGSDGTIYVAAGSSVQTIAPGASSRTALASDPSWNITGLDTVGGGSVPTAQEVEFTSIAPDEAVVDGPAYTPTATGGDSGNPVTFSTTTPDVCSIDEDDEVTFDHAGDCTVAADQAGGTVDGVTYADAETVTQDITVAKATQTIAFAEDSPTEGSVGDSFTPAATGGESGNPVTFSIDEDSADVCSIDDGTVTLNARGTCTVDADQAGDEDYEPATTTSLPVAVDVAPTTLDLEVTTDGMTATVSAPAGSGTPTGMVTFGEGRTELALADLTPVAGQPGVARASVDELGTTDEVVTLAAEYAPDTAGEDTWGGSFDTYDRTPPTLDSRVTSDGDVNDAGWYRTPVTVQFACTAGTGELTGACPGTFRRSNTGAGFVLTRTITGADGGTDSLELPLQVDVAAPVVTIRRVGTSPYNRESRPIRCQATDNRSGLAGPCRVSYGPVTRGPNGGARRGWSAVATDVAGNTTMRSGSYVVNGPAPAARTSRSASDR